MRHAFWHFGFGRGFGGGGVLIEGGPSLGTYSIKMFCFREAKRGEKK